MALNKYPDYYVEFLKGKIMILESSVAMHQACLKNDKLWRYVGDE